MNTVAVRRSFPRHSVFADFDNLVRHAFYPATYPAARATQTGFPLAAEIDREGDDALVRLDLPGVDVEKDVTVELDKGHLVIKGERRDARAASEVAQSEDTESQKKDTRSLREIRYGAFRRSFRLPAGINADAISASYDAGVLTVRVAGVHAGTEAQRIAISA